MNKKSKVMEKGVKVTGAEVAIDQHHFVYPQIGYSLKMASRIEELELQVEELEEKVKLLEMWHKVVG